MQTVDAEPFETYRPLMLSIAYRMLGSLTDAEDMVQKAYLRYQATPFGEIRSPKAFLSTVVTRLCLNYLQLAQTQREQYFGEWLPEPILTEPMPGASPLEALELHESLSLAFLTLLEQLSPMERAVFLLREVFDYDYVEIAEMVGKEEAACRQLLSRAKKHITANRPRFKPSPETHRQLLTNFIEAAANGDMDGLMQLLSEDVMIQADSGGKVPGALVRPLRGREPVARFVMATARRTLESKADAAIEMVEVNGELAMRVKSGGTVIIVLAITSEHGQITSVRAIGNPDKLRWVSQSNPKEES